MNDNQNEPEKLTRKQYRKLKDGKPSGTDDVNSNDPVSPVDEHPTNRVNPERVARKADADYKTPRWRRINHRLNISMVILIVLIIIVYLILIFIN